MGERNTRLGSRNPLIRAAGITRDVLLPRGCAGCDRPDAVLCPQCRELFAQCRPRALQGSVSGHAYAAAIYQGAARRAILSWKDHDDTELDGPFSEIMTGLLARTPLCDLARPAPQRSTPRQSTPQRVLVVPAPSSRASMRGRGRRHMMPLASAVSHELQVLGLDAQAVPALASHTVGGRSVQQASSAQRARRIGGHITVTRDATVEDRMVILVDDIITTGATLRQCAQTLQQAGAQVLGALALAEAVSRDNGDEGTNGCTSSVTTPHMSGQLPSFAR